MTERRLAVALRQAVGIPLDVAFTCEPGEVLAIFGPSGAGKTTILRAIAGLHRPAHASIRAGGRCGRIPPRPTFVPAHARGVGYVFQDYALFPHLTALDNVAVALGHRPRVERRRRAEALLALVQLSDRMTRRPLALSGGERQPVALARALARDPAVLLLDEPFAAVDRATRRRLQDDLDGLRRSLHIPVVLVTHDFDDVVRLATHVLLLERGRSVASGPIAEVGLGSVFDAVVARVFPERGLVEIAFEGGALLAASRSLTVGAVVRVRIPAREVILATAAPHGLSLHNVLSGTVTALDPDPPSAHVIVQLAIGGSRLLAEVTQDAVSTLRMAPGVQLHALIKSVSIQTRDLAAAP